MRKTVLSIITFVALAVAVVESAVAFAAAVPTTLSYQGSLSDKGGSPFSGTRTLVFSLYNVSTGGTAVWSETQTLTVNGGRFGAVLGVVSPIDISMLSGATWLGIAVQGEPEMIPRQSLTSVPYAVRAAVADNVTSSDSLVPAGTVVAYAGATAPAGWLPCDGSAVSRATYSRLFAAIGTAHGYGDNSTTFNLPDYRGRFLRGVDGTAGNDPDKAGRTAMQAGGNTGNNVGSVQEEQFKSHTHTWLNNSAPIYRGVSYRAANGGSGGGDFSYATSAAGGSETRPKNAYVNWIVKY